MVEKIIDAVFEGVGVDDPSTERNLDAELMLFIVLAMERRERGVVAVGEGEHRAGGGDQRRRLVEAAIGAAEDPGEFGDLDGHADAWGGGVLGKGALKCDCRRPAVMVSQEVAL